MDEVEQASDVAKVKVRHEVESKQLSSLKARLLQLQEETKEITSLRERLAQLQEETDQLRSLVQVAPVTHCWECKRWKRKGHSVFGDCMRSTGVMHSPLVTTDHSTCGDPDPI